ncbi:MAG: response regulator [Candidatus Eisenbacteria bacterium]|uniref:Response regulator n=1 Tax=Eiseniibacteriota bacterium TaxID=2212470 RepID=A0A948RUT2_UNCEI|nr:response regulator [Candidatus Eisenbacteria bacterium]MBU1948853.1 response regulator [Candidatus Eisenbacteria bacterium]MBU2691275.1 response regulator [Candidatus Eisenbacteria bacterium]
MDIELVDSKVGRGTQFDVFIPIHGGHVESDSEESSRPIYDAGRKRILFVDAERSILDLAKISLEKSGYDVTVFEDSRLALEAFRKDPDEYDILVTDQTMPGLVGSDLAKAVLEIRPGLPVILCSGYSKAISEDMADSMGIKGYLFKPVSREVLSNTIRQIFEARAA